MSAADLARRTPAERMAHKVTVRTLRELREHMRSIIYTHPDMAVREASLWLDLLRTSPTAGTARQWGFDWIVTRTDIATAAAALDRFARIFGAPRTTSRPASEIRPGDVLATGERVIAIGQDAVERVNAYGATIERVTIAIVLDTGGITLRHPADLVSIRLTD